MPRQHRLDRIQLSEHCCHKNIVTCAFANEKERDVAVPHVASAADPHFKIPCTPIPCRVQKMGSVSEHLFRLWQICVSGNDELLDDVRLNRGWPHLHRSALPESRK